MSILFLIMICVKQMIRRYVQQFYWWCDSMQGCWLFRIQKCQALLVCWFAWTLKLLRQVWRLIPTIWKQGYWNSLHHLVASMTIMQIVQHEPLNAVFNAFVSASVLLSSSSSKPSKRRIFVGHRKEASGELFSVDIEVDAAWSNAEVNYWRFWCGGDLRTERGIMRFKRMCFRRLSSFLMDLPISIFPKHR